MSKLWLVSLSEDVLINIVLFLKPPDIAQLALTCKSLYELTSLRLVWVNASRMHVISRGFPFPDVPVDNMPTIDLISTTKRGYYLAQRWREGLSSPRSTRHIARTSGTSVSEMRFIPGSDGRLLAMISKSIWSVLSVWDISDGTNSSKICEWSPRGAIFSGFALNSDVKGQSDVTIAVSLQLAEQHFVKILALRKSDDLQLTLEEVFSMDNSMIPVTLSGNILALSDDVCKTAIWNWKEGTHGMLEHPRDEPPTLLQSNECLQVLFAYKSIFVARARSIHLFPFPILSSSASLSPTSYQPVAGHSFGWIDGECMAVCPFLDTALPYNIDGGNDTCLPLSILVRGETDDPWTSDVHNLELYTLHPNPAYDPLSDVLGSPYLFPPRISHRVSSLHGSLRCKKVVLGRFGTALWVQPRDRFAGGLLADIQQHFVPRRNSSYESLVATVFPGSLCPISKDRDGENGQGPMSLIGTKIYENTAGTSWTSFDYDEIGGRVALGSSFGIVKILYL